SQCDQCRAPRAAVRLMAAVARDLLSADMKRVSGETAGAAQIGRRGWIRVYVVGMALETDVVLWHRLRRRRRRRWLLEKMRIRGAVRAADVAIVARVAIGAGNDAAPGHRPDEGALVDPRVLPLVLNRVIRRIERIRKKRKVRLARRLCRPAGMT